jgi:hypothetical protein
VGVAAGTGTGCRGREPAGEPQDPHAAISQLRLDSDGRAYHRRKRAEGKKPLEALRCLKRRISDALYDSSWPTPQPLRTRASTRAGRALRATQESGAVDLRPHIDTSDQPLPGPAKPLCVRIG